MTCTDVRDFLPAHVYGDLTGDDAVAVTAHLRECETCHSEAAALARTRAALDETPTPSLRVDVAGLFATLAERRVRRWRRVAIAGTALAACLLVGFALRLNVTVGDGRLVIAWTDASREREPSDNSAARTNAPGTHTPDSPRLDHLDERLQVQEELTRALIADVDVRDRRLAADLDTIRQQVAAVGQFAARQWAEAERTMNALYVAQFKRPEEKVNP
jgi:hypothetical protein